MEKEFIPYELAVKLKELGFDEPCFTFYNGKFIEFKIWDDNGATYPQINVDMDIGKCVSAPTFSQAFRFFRVKYSICVEIHETTDWEEDNESWSFVIFKYRLGDNDGMISSTIDYDTYEDAELDCLKKLIEIVK